MTRIKALPFCTLLLACLSSGAFGALDTQMVNKSVHMPPVANKAKSFSLPIWKEEAEKLGYELPLPFGVNVSYMHLQQGIVVDHVGGFNSVQLSPVELKNVIGQIVPNFAFLADLKGIHNYSEYLIRGIQTKPKQGKQKTDVFSVRADVWLFPFLNLYAIAGKMKGNSTTEVDYWLPAFDNKIFAHEMTKHMQNKFQQKLSQKILENLSASFNGAQGVGKIDEFKLNLDGYLYGAGFVLAGGYDRFFGLVDLSYTQTKLTVVDGSISALVISPRIGYDFHDFGLPLRFWTGAMYQNVEQELSGKLANLNLPDMQVTLKKPDGTVLGTVPIPKINTGEYQVKQHLVTKWNPLLGVQYYYSKNIGAIVEVGLGERKSVFATIDIRF